jgi:hypothetical protein
MAGKKTTVFLAACCTCGFLGILRAKCGKLLGRLFFFSLIVLTAPLRAEEPRPGVLSGTDLTLQVSSLPEAKFGLVQSFTFPFLQGKNLLTADNNIKTAFTAELSPISLNGLAEALWTPIAFFQLAAGARAGSGWNITLFGSKVRGIGINRDNGSGVSETLGSAFNGLLWKTHLGGALQFDAAALIPGDWHHVVFRSYHEINYKGYTAASSGDSWYFENDDGENRNGFNYYGSLLLGYQMPLFLNTVGLLAEGDLYLYDTPNRDQWGDELIRWTFSGLLNFTITKQFSAAFLVQLRTRRNYEDPYWEDLFYQRRHIGSTPLYLEFYRVAAVLVYTLR